MRARDEVGTGERDLSEDGEAVLLGNHLDLGEGLLDNGDDHFVELRRDAFGVADVGSKDFDAAGGAIDDLDAARVGGGDASILHTAKVPWDVAEGGHLLRRALGSRENFALGVVGLNAERREAAADEGVRLASDFRILMRERDVVHVGENDEVLEGKLDVDEDEVDDGAEEESAEHGALTDALGADDVVRALAVTQVEVGSA